MSSKLRTVLLDSNRTDTLSVGVDTLLRGVLRLPERVFAGPRINRNRLLRRLVGQRYDALSYMADWQEAFLRAPDLEIRRVNVTNLVAYHRARPLLKEADLIVVLHSAAGDDMSLLLRTAHWFAERRGRLAVFIGNEYELMDEKKQFLRQSGADFVCSQLPLETAEWLYRDHEGAAAVLHMPHALNPDAYRDQGRERTIDLGFVGDLYERTIGDRERTDLIRYFEHRTGDDLRCDIRVNRRMPRDDWSAFLNNCHGIIGAESGTYFVDRKGLIIENAKAYRRKHPDASYEEIVEACFQPTVEFRSGKAISSRHFEPIGTRTCQLLIEGDYNGILKPEEHYIAVRRDLSDVDSAVERFRDATYRRQIATNAFEHAMSAHTHAHRVRQLVNRVTART